MRRTSLGLTQIDPGESPWEDGGSFFGRNQDVIDHLMRLGALTHRHDAHAALPAPTTAPTVTTNATGGQLDAGLDIYIAVTAIDAAGGETLPITVTAVTPGALSVPGPPAGVPDYLAGDLPANVYYYAITATDGLGGETAPSDPLLVTVEAGHANGEVSLTGMQTAATAVGGTGWRLYRSVNGGPYGFLSAGATDAFTDDCSHCVDPQLPPPDDTGQTAAGSAMVVVTMPAVDLPAGTARYRIYASGDPSYPSPALLGEFDVADAGTAHNITTLALSQGQPPAVATAVGGAQQVKATSDIDWTGWTGGGGGSIGPTDVLPPLPDGMSWNPPKAAMDAATVRWGADGAEKLALIAQMVEASIAPDLSFAIWGTAYAAADWRGDTTEWTWDATAGTGGLVGSGAAGTYLLERVATAPTYGDGGVWDAQFHIDNAATWDHLFAGGVSQASSNAGFLAILDRAASQLQIALITATAPLAYTVVATAPVNLATVGVGRATIYVRWIGNTLYAMALDNADAPLLADYLTYDLTGSPIVGGSAFGAFGAGWSAANALRVQSMDVSLSTVLTELIAAGAVQATDGAGNPTWTPANGTVLWRSDGSGGGLPDAWQGFLTLTEQNGWANVPTDGDGGAYVRWGGRVLWRGRIANTVGWQVGSEIAEMPTSIQPFTDRHFYVGAETTGGVLGIARIDVTPEDTTVTPSVPAKMVLGAVSVADPAVALDLEGVAWEVG